MHIQISGVIQCDTAVFWLNERIHKAYHKLSAAGWTVVCRCVVSYCGAVVFWMLTSFCTAVFVTANLEKAANSDVQTKMQITRAQLTSTNWTYCFLLLRGLWSWWILYEERSNILLWERPFKSSYQCSCCGLFTSNDVHLAQPLHCFRIPPCLWQY